MVCLLKRVPQRRSLHGQQLQFPGRWQAAPPAAKEPGGWQASTPNDAVAAEAAGTLEEVWVPHVAPSSGTVRVAEGDWWWEGLLSGGHRLWP